jgi:hypothetical protein
LRKTIISGGKPEEEIKQMRLRDPKKKVATRLEPGTEGSDKSNKMHRVLDIWSTITRYDFNTQSDRSKQMGGRKDAKEDRGVERP